MSSSTKEADVAKRFGLCAILPLLPNSCGDVMQFLAAPVLSFEEDTGKVEAIRQYIDQKELAGMTFTKSVAL